MPFVLHGVAVTRAQLLPPDPDMCRVLQHIWKYELEHGHQDVQIGILSLLPRMTWPSFDDGCDHNLFACGVFFI